MIPPEYSAPKEPKEESKFCTFPDFDEYVFPVKPALHLNSDFSSIGRLFTQKIYPNQQEIQQNERIKLTKAQKRNLARKQKKKWLQNQNRVEMPSLPAER